MNDLVEFQKIAAILLRWWWLLVSATLIGAAMGYMVSQWQTPVYQASTTILVGQSMQSTQLDSRDIAASEQLAGTYATIAKLEPVLQSVVESLHLDTDWQSLRNRVRATSLERTQLLKITVDADSPGEARALANEIANALVSLSPATLQNQGEDEGEQFLRQRLEKLSTNVIDGQTRIDTLESSILATSSTAEMEKLQREVDAIQSLIIGWESNYARLHDLSKGQGSPNYLTIVESAQATPDPVQPRTMLNMLVVSLVCLLLTSGTVIFLDFSDETLKPMSTLGKTLGVAILGTVPRIRGTSDADKLVTASDPLSPGAEAYAMVRSSILFRYGKRFPKSIAVISPGDSEGKSLTVANLGVTIAQAGFSTIVVDTNLMHPMLHKFFNIPDLEGMLDMLGWPGLEVERLLKGTTIPNLRVLTSGTAMSESSTSLLPQWGRKDMQATQHQREVRLLSHMMVSYLAQIVVNLGALADVVIFDSPSLLSHADAAILSSHVDGIVLVTKAGQTRASTARRAIFTLQQAGATLLGVVLNQTSTVGGMSVLSEAGEQLRQQTTFLTNGQTTSGQPEKAALSHLVTSEN